MKLKDKTGDFKGISSLQQTPGCTPRSLGSPPLSSLMGQKVEGTSLERRGSRAESEPASNCTSAHVPMLTEQALPFPIQVPETRATTYSK